MKRDLPIVQKTYDLVKWYVPILNKLPRDHKSLLGDRIITGLYDLLEGLILSAQRYKHVSQLIDGIGQELGGWMRQQHQKAVASA